MNIIKRLSNKNNTAIDFLIEHTQKGKCYWATDPERKARYICSYKNTFYDIDMWNSEENEGVIVINRRVGNKNYQHCSNDDNKDYFDKSLILISMIKRKFCDL
ncbi:hypothetical protein ACI6Q2_13590 [Chitinophagaceae bacterium LWZ2-11]